MSQPNKNVSEKSREASRYAERLRQFKIGRFLDCLLAIAALSQLALVCFSKLGLGAKCHLGDMEEELFVIREKSESLQRRLKEAARAMGHAPYAREMHRRRLFLWQGLKKLFRELGPHE